MLLPLTGNPLIRKLQLSLSENRGGAFMQVSPPLLHLIRVCLRDFSKKLQLGRGTVSSAAEFPFYPRARLLYVHTRLGLCSICEHA